jgi:hypothetical protein
LGSGCRRGGSASMSCRAPFGQEIDSRTRSSELPRSLRRCSVMAVHRSLLRSVTAALNPTRARFILLVCCAPCRSNIAWEASAHPSLPRTHTSAAAPVQRASQRRR